MSILGHPSVAVIAVLTLAIAFGLETHNWNNLPGWLLTLLYGAGVAALIAWLMAGVVARFRPPDRA